MQNQQAEEGDIQIGPINMGQTMAIMAHSLRCTVASFVESKDTEKERQNLALVCLSIFLQQYISAAIKPELYAPILEILIKEVCNAKPQPTSI